MGFLFVEPVPNEEWSSRSGAREVLKPFGQLRPELSIVLRSGKELASRHVVANAWT
jgi:hypothetical protein